MATRNYIGVLTSVNCSATAARAIADHFRRDIHPEALAAYPNVDGVVALTHGMGCATASDGEELQVLRRSIYIGNQNTYTVPRYEAALARAMEMRKEAEEAYQRDVTRAKRVAAKQL